MPHRLIKKLQELVNALPALSEEERKQNVQLQYRPIILSDEVFSLLEQIEDMATDRFGSDIPDPRAANIMEAHGFPVMLLDHEDRGRAMATIVTVCGNIPYR